jgi:hypothetical protein
LAQTCQPYWTNIPTDRLPGYSTGIIQLYAGVGDEGPGIYEFCEQVGDSHRWDGQQWVQIPRDGIPANYHLIEMTFLDEGLGPKVYLNTWYATGDPQNPRHTVTFRRIDGVWHPMPLFFWGTDQAPGYPLPLASMDFGSGMHIYGVGGSLQAMVLRWAGANWDLIGASGPHAPANIATNLVSYDSGSGPALYAFGGMITAGGVSSQFARYNGATWEALTPDVGAAGYQGQAAVFDWGQGPRLVAAGAHFSSGSTNQATMSVFDGTSWTEVGISNSPEGIFTVAGQVAVYDDGRGPAVFMTGEFADMNNVPSHGIARWDGQGWSSVPGGLLMASQQGAHSMVVMDTPEGRALVIVGRQDAPGDMSAAHGATSQAVMYVGCPNCYANCDLSTTPPILNVNDFLCFLNAFARRDPYANCNNDANFDAADFQCFMNRFAAGCP